MNVGNVVFSFRLTKQTSGCIIGMDIWNNIHKSPGHRKKKTKNILDWGIIFPQEELTEMKVHWFLLSEGIGMTVTNYHKTKQKYNFDNIDRTYFHQYNNDNYRFRISLQEWILHNLTKKLSFSNLVVETVSIIQLWCDYI